MNERDEIHEEAHERATNDGYLRAHAHRQDMQRRADAATIGADPEKLARQREEARRAMKGDPRFRGA